MVNNYEYAWEDIKVILPGSSVPSESVTAIEYDVQKEHTNIYGAGDSPVAMGRGKKEFSGKVTVLQSLIESMQRSLAGGKDLTGLISFNITVSYAPEGGVATTDQLVGCRIKKLPKSMKTGDPNQEIELELAVFKINYNV